MPEQRGAAEVGCYKGGARGTGVEEPRVSGSCCVWRAAGESSMWYSGNSGEPASGYRIVGRAKMGVNAVWGS